MVDLNSQFRQNATILNDHIPSSKEILYLRNVSLQNKRFKLITKAGNLLKLSDHEALAEYNKASSLNNTDSTYQYLEACISPYMISSDFDMVFISSRLANRFKEVNPNTLVDNRALSKVIVAASDQTAGNSYAGTIYFDYSEETVLYQTVVIGILKTKVDKAIELNRSRTDTVIAITNDDTAVADNWSINRITSEAVLDSGVYYLTINVPNETKILNYTVHSTLDRTGTYFSEVTKKLKLTVTKNNISPYALYRLAPYDLAATPYSRTINGATLPSKAYNNRKYVQYYHEAREDIVEVVVRYTNTSGTITRQLLTPEFGNYDDNSFIIKKYEVTSGSALLSIYRIKNATFLLQYLISLTSNDTLWFNAYHIDNGSYGLMHDDDYLVKSYGDWSYTNANRFCISREAIGVNEAFNVKMYRFITNKRDALRVNTSHETGYVYTGNGKLVDLYDSGWKDLEGNSVQAFGLNANSETSVYNHVIERISGGIVIWTFQDGKEPIFGLVGKVTIALPMFTADEPLYLMGLGTTLMSKVMVKGVDYDFTLIDSVTNSNVVVSSSTTLLTDLGEV